MANEKKYKVTSFKSKRYPGNIELFINDDTKEMYFNIHFDTDFVTTKKQIKEIVSGYFGTDSEWSANKKLTEIVDDVFWFIKK